MPAGIEPQELALKRSLGELTACGESDPPRSTGGGGDPPFHLGSVPPAPVLSTWRRWLGSGRVSLALSDDVFSVLRMTPEGFVKEMRLAAAVKWHALGLLSQAKAAEVAGVSRHALLAALSRFKGSPFQTSPEQPAQELGRA